VEEEEPEQDEEEEEGEQVPGRVSAVSIETTDAVRDVAARELKAIRGALETVVKKLRSKVQHHTQGGKAELVDQFFIKCDTNGDGELSLDEFKSVIRTVCKFSRSEMGEAELKTLFHVLDSEGAGSVDVAKFKEFVMEVPANAPPGSPKHKNRLEQMYAEAAMKKAKLEAKKKQKDADEQAKLDEGRKKDKTISMEQAMLTAERLYNEAFKAESRLQEKRKNYDQNQKQALQQRALQNRPTNNQIRDSLGNAAEAARRLHRDAERRDRDRQLRFEESCMVEQEYFANFQPAPFRTRRHLDLYAEALSRRERAESRIAESVNHELGCLREVSVPTADEYNHERILELHAEHAEKQKKVATQLAEKQMKDEAKINENLIASKRSMDMTLGYRPTGMLGHRPSIVDDPRSPRSVRSLTRKRREEEEQKQLRNERELSKRLGKRPSIKSSYQLVTGADHIVNTIIQTVQQRLGFNANTDQIFDADNRPLANEMNEIVAIVRDAQRNCELSGGYGALCNRASERLFNQHLVPEFEGWVRNIEPDRIVQVEDDLDQLLDSARKAQAELRITIAGESWTTGSGAVKSHPEGCPIALFVYDNGPKTDASARAKALCRHAPGEGVKGSYRHLLDLARLLLVFSNCDMLSSGLDQILRRFEVVDVRNYFARPGRLGIRFVEVLVVVQVNRGDEMHPDLIPHVCELRLEEMCFHKAQEGIAPALRNWYTSYHHLYDRPSRDPACLSFLAHQVMFRPAVPHDVRVFKCHFAKRYGSTISGWRKEFGSSKLLDFRFFKTACQKMGYGERATEFWQGLDPHLGGAISLFDFDQEAVSLLIHLRQRLIALADTGPSSDKIPCVEPESIFARLSFLIRPISPGKLEPHEWRKCMLPMGLSHEEADKAFKYLDLHHTPPLAVTVSDISWLMNLPALTDVDSVSIHSANALSNSDALRHITWSAATARHNKRGEILRWTIFRESANEKESTREQKLFIRNTMRSKSEEPRGRNSREMGDLTMTRAPSDKTLLRAEFLAGGEGRFTPRTPPPTPPLTEKAEMADSDDDIFGAASARQYRAVAAPDAVVESPDKAKHRMFHADDERGGAYQIVASPDAILAASPGRNKRAMVYSDSEDDGATVPTVASPSPVKRTMVYSDDEDDEDDESLARQQGSSIAAGASPVEAMTSGEAACGAASSVAVDCLPESPVSPLLAAHLDVASDTFGASGIVNPVVEEPRKTAKGAGVIDDSLFETF
jgi:hypothetical protein